MKVRELLVFLSDVDPELTVYAEGDAGLYDISCELETNAMGKYLLIFPEPTSGPMTSTVV